ncbi:glycosyltransferase family 4 protein [Phaeocystidibacter luteus]|uniref:Glycosyltransferase family 4 protein n=2 Tax=Phaeocystidibacter luteus TaxID=911197 RepID=A0A6N6RDJ5_9FLAO|nr:glycosyltransferase family 4 protein [Phaeocystidibacter luteus]
MPCRPSHFLYLSRMKIAFIARSTLLKQPGGDTQQVTETARELERLGIDVDIILSGQRMRVAEYDLLHFFNLGRPADLLRYPAWKSKPTFVSTIWVDYGSGSKGEWMKAIGRGLIGNDKLPPLHYILQGHEKSLAEIVDHADLFITTTQLEIDKLKASFPKADPTYIVHPGINRDFTEPLPPEKEERSGILCVGRFEPLKNQLAVIEATRGWDEPVTFVGNAASNNPSYYKKCRAEAGSNHSFRPHSSMHALQMLYRSHKVVVVPSHFETFGLTALEGLSQGCNLVLSSTTGAAEVVGEHARLFVSKNSDELSVAIREQLDANSQTEGKKFARQFSWESAAEKLVELYQTRLSVNS